jgi:hypothetical protein
MTRKLFQCICIVLLLAHLPAGAKTFPAAATPGDTALVKKIETDFDLGIRLFKSRFRYVDTTRIRRFRLNNNVQIFGGTSVVDYSFSSNAPAYLEHSPFTYIASSSAYAGFEINYKFLSLALSRGIPGTYLNKDIRGINDISLGTSYFWRQLGIRASFSNYTGLLHGDAENGYEITKGLSSLRVSAQLYYIHNARRYSYSAGTAQSELQRHSAGSFLFMVSPAFQRFRSEGTILPDSIDKEMYFGKYAGMRRLMYTGFDLMPGYGFNIVAAKGHLYFSPTGFIGPGVYFYRLKTSEATGTGMSYAISGAFMLNAGYNSNRFFINARIKSSFSDLVLNPSTIESANTDFQLVLGYRFADLERRLPASPRKLWERIVK